MNLSKQESSLELEKYCNEKIPIQKIQKSIPDQKPISLPNRPSSGKELQTDLQTNPSIQVVRSFNIGRLRF